ncbi:MAG TPA: hypothetical protein VFU59_00340 [Candidatus Eisenbacteria bacterium]|nr:hypothetical protein [Candidatus Eisenbacteria bacterium]
MGLDSGISHTSAFSLELRDLLFQSRAGADWVLTSEADNLLLSIWSEVAETVDPADRRLPVGLSLAPAQELEGFQVRFLTFPIPEDIAENHFAAIALRPAAPGIFFWKRQRSLVRFITLERTISFSSEKDETVLGEWAGVKHLNYGPGPEPVMEDFAVAVQPLLRGETERIANSRFSE